MAWYEDDVLMYDKDVMEIKDHVDASVKAWKDKRGFE